MGSTPKNKEICRVTSLVVIIAKCNLEIRSAPERVNI